MGRPDLEHSGGSSPLAPEATPENPMRPRHLLTLLLFVSLTACHPIQGIPPEGLRVIEAKPGIPPHYGALITIQAFEYSIGAHGEVYPESLGAARENLRVTEEGLQLETIPDTPGVREDQRPGTFAFDDYFLSMEHQPVEIDGADVTRPCLWRHFVGPVYCLDPGYDQATAAPTPDGDAVMILLTSPDHGDALEVLRLDLRDETRVTENYTVDLSSLGADLRFDRQAMHVDNDGTIAFAGTWLDEGRGALIVLGETPTDLFTDGDRFFEPLRVFRAHGRWGVLTERNAALLSPDGGHDRLDLADTNPWEPNLWMESFGELILTTSRTLVVVEEVPYLITAATVRIEEGNTPMVGRHSPSVHGVEVCATALDDSLETATSPECILRRL